MDNNFQTKRIIMMIYINRYQLKNCIEIYLKKFFK